MSSELESDSLRAVVTVVDLLVELIIGADSDYCVGPGPYACDRGRVAKFDKPAALELEDHVSGHSALSQIQLYVSCLSATGLRRSRFRNLGVYGHDSNDLDSDSDLQCTCTDRSQGPQATRNLGRKDAP